MLSFWSCRLNFTLNPIPPGLFEGGSFRGGGGGGKVPAAHNSKTISDNGIKFGGVVKNHKLINIGVVYLAYDVIITS